jgi:DNA ligase D-like protein (predicted ligase)
MLAELADPFDSEGHLFEVKWDGARVIAFIDRGRLRLQSRRLLDITYRYPDLKETLPKALKRRQAVLDGELIAIGPGGNPDFGLLQSREQQQNPFRIRVAAERVPVVYVAFDVLQVGERPLIDRPLAERRKVLSWIIRPGPSLVESQGVVGPGRALFEAVRAQGLEGIMAKRLDSPYLIGKRSSLWLKIKPRQSEVFHIIGYTPGKGYRAGQFGALAIGEMTHAEMRYMGRVGSGLTDEQLADIINRLRPLETGEVSKAGRHALKETHWVRPVLRCRVSYQERTASGALRAPVFEGLVEAGTACTDSGAP